MAVAALVSVWMLQQSVLLTACISAAIRLLSNNRGFVEKMYIITSTVGKWRVDSDLPESFADPVGEIPLGSIHAGTGLNARFVRGIYAAAKRADRHGDVTS